ncbi:MAG TPA: NADP-dependent oxidoreductase [Acidimicrobiia bacterium]
MTKRVVATAAGGPEVLELVEEPDRDPGPAEVLIEVRAAGVNPVDAKRYARASGSAHFPMALGFEAAGVVLAVGSDASGPRGPVADGDDVIAYRIDGAYADRVVVPADAVVPKPTALAWEPASGLMLTGATAIHALTVVDVGPGDTVLLHGAAGGVGIMATQLAVDRGARVIGTAREANQDFLRGLGAEPVTYGDGLLERVRAVAPDGVDAAIDAAGTPEALEVSLALVELTTRCTTIVARKAAFDAGIHVLGGAPGADPGTEIRNAARLELVDRVAAGTLEVVVAGTYPLAAAADAHREVMGGHVRGKVVLVP